MVNDDLDKLIEETRSQLDAARIEVNKAVAKAEVLEIRLSAYEDAAALRPPKAARKSYAGVAVRNGSGGGGKGRQPGAISQPWKDTLHYVYMMSYGPINYQEFQKIAGECGVKAELAAVRDRIRRFIELGFVSGNADDGFSVTEEAAERFGFNKMKEPQPEGQGSFTVPGEATG